MVKFPRQQYFKSLLLLATGACAGIFFLAIAAFEKKEAPKNEKTSDARLKYSWYAPELPAEIDFAGEKAPLDRWEVRERLDRDILMNYYMHGSLLYILKLSNRYFPVIEEQLKANGIPDDFKYLCVAESSLQQLTSSAGAQGMWQFIKETGTRYGLEINDEVDERYHVKKSAGAACKYFLEAYQKFGSWTAAAAAYNCGQAGYAGYANFQGTNNYYELALPEETARYMFRIMALKYLISGARQMGYILEHADGYKPVKTRTVTVSTTIENLALFATENGSSYKMLKLCNPWLRARRLTVKPGKTYEIEFPSDKQ